MIVDLYGARIKRAVSVATRDVRNLIDKYDDMKPVILAVMEVVKTKELNDINDEGVIQYINLLSSIEVEQ